jgi:hypothetical protein
VRVSTNAVTCLFTITKDCLYVQPMLSDVTITKQFRRQSEGMLNSLSETPVFVNAQTGLFRPTYLFALKELHTLFD